MTFGNDGSSAESELHQRLMAAVRHALASTSTPGAAVALLLDNRPVFVSGVGFRDHEQTVMLEPDAQFYVYSVTKSLLATVMLQLVEQGRIALDAPIQAYLPNLPLDPPVTVRQLLNHTAGIPDYGGLPAYFESLKADPTQPWTSDEFLSNTLTQGLTFAPGQGWGYSNIGFLMLRMLIEEVTSTSLRAALHERLFAPLDLQHTLVAQTLDDAPRLTPGYSAFFSSDGSLEDIRSLYHPGWVSHGVVIATAAELAQVIDAIFTGQLISPQSRAAMLEPVRVPVAHPLFRQPAYGLGLMIDPRSPHGLIAGHGGGGPGYSAGALHLPDVHGRSITSIALANRDQNDLGLHIAFTLATMLAEAVTD